jgi:hypothetical protein
MSTADYALIVSISSAFIAVASLIWNVWQKYIFVKPQVQVGFGVYHIMEPTGSPDRFCRSERTPRDCGAY